MGGKRLTSTSGDTPAIEAVQRLTRILTRVQDVSDMKSLALDAAMGVIGVEAGSILTYDGAAGALVFDAVRGPIAGKLVGSSISANSRQGIVAHVWRSRQARIVNDAPSSPDHDPSVSGAFQFVTRSLLTVPLRPRNGEPFGVMQLVNRSHGVFDERDEAVLEIIGNVLSMAIENAQLSQEVRLAAVARSLGELGHDIGNMLCGVLPYVQMIGVLIEDARAGKKNAMQDLVSFYEEASCAVGDSVAQIQALAREVAAAVKGEIAPLDLKSARPLDIASQVVRALAEKARRGNVCLSADGDELSATLDRRRLYNAIFNLANNALDETEPGGSVAVEVLGGDLEYHVLVRDTGRGMTEDVRRRLFTDAAVSTKADGTGLGTRIVRRVVEQHRGAVAVESELGVGTSVEMTLPINPVDLS